MALLLMDMDIGIGILRLGLLSSLVHCARVMCAFLNITSICMREKTTC